MPRTTISLPRFAASRNPFSFAVAALFLLLLVSTTAQAGRFERGPDDGDLPLRRTQPAATKPHVRAESEHVHMRVQIRDTTGLAVRSVSLRLNGKIIGKTDAGGVFQTEVLAKTGETLTLTVDAPDGYRLPATTSADRWRARVQGAQGEVKFNVILEPTDAELF